MGQDIYYMGRKSKDEEDKKIKISVSIDRDLYKKIKLDKQKPSRILENLLRKYYEDKNLQEM